MFSTHSGWNAGTVNNDGGTDNMVVGGYNSTYYEKGIWKVPSNNDNWSNGLSLARYCNYFFEQVLPRGQKMISNTTSVKCISCVP